MGDEERHIHYYPCDCHDPGHALYIEYDEEDNLLFIGACFLGLPGLKDRIKNAFKVLRGHDHLIHDVILNSKTVYKPMHHIVDYALAMNNKSRESSYDD